MRVHVRDGQFPRQWAVPGHFPRTWAIPKAVGWPSKITLLTIIEDGTKRSSGAFAQARHCKGLRTLQLQKFSKLKFENLNSGKEYMETVSGEREVGDQKSNLEKSHYFLIIKNSVHGWS